MGDPPAQDLLEAALTAPKFGVNAKALILQHAMRQDEEEEAAAAAARKRLRTDPAVAAATFAAQRGADYLAAVDAKRRPQVAYVARSTIPRINRQTVLNKLAGEHLALAAQPRRLRPQPTAADDALTQGAFEAAVAQELDLFGRCGSAVVYRNLAARTAASQWPPAQAALQAVSQEHQRRLAEQATEQQRQQRPAGMPGLTAKQLEEAELDWDAAAPAGEEEEQQVATCAPVEAAAAGGPVRTPALGAAAAVAVPAPQTLLGGLAHLQPLPALLPGAGAAEPPPAAQQQAGAAGGTGAAAAEGAVALQVELFVRAELHPHLKRQQISQQEHDAVCERCVAKVLQRHAGAPSADFLVAEAGGVRRLVLQYLKHVQQQRKPP